MKFYDQRALVLGAPSGDGGTPRSQMAALRNRLFSRWVAREMGLIGPKEDAYVGLITAMEYRPGGDIALVDKAVTDLVAIGNILTPGEIRAAFLYFEIMAEQEIGGREGYDA